MATDIVPESKLVNSTNRVSIGENIKIYRKRKKKTQKEISDIIGKSARMLQKYESNEVTPSLEVIDDIAKALDVEKKKLLGIKSGIALINFTTKELIEELKRRNISLNDFIGGGNDES